MNNASLVRRYLPLALVLAVQLVIIAAVPSKAPEAQQLGAAGALPGAAAPGQGTPVIDSSGNVVGTIPAGGGAAGSAGGAAGTATAGAAGAAGGAGTGAAAGDTSHCKDGRQFDPALIPYAPPCVPKFAGDNGGATYRGVTKDAIKVVIYDGNGGAALDALLTAAGSNPSPQEVESFAAAAQKFINERYELYGRKLQFKRVAGQCATVPPDYPCLRNEMRQIVQQEQPFAVVWNTSLASPAFDELSKLQVVNLGGWGFRDAFNISHRPYHWDIQMGGSQLVRAVSDWYCRRLYGGGQAKASFAGAPDLQGRVRNLGVISTDDPENKLAISELKALLKQQCGAAVQHEYYYAQDLTTAEQQRRAAVAKMREGGPTGEATTIMCFCDLIAPIFLYQTCEEQQYYPEHVMVATGFMDSDRAAQAYDNTLQPKGRQFENAFGLAQSTEQLPQASNLAARVWKSAGNAGVPYQSAEADLQYYLLLATMLQAAGPRLTPQAIEAGVGRVGFLGGNTQATVNGRSLDPAKGDYTWNDNLREVYWSPTKPSPFNGKPGRYLSLNNGRWFKVGEFPAGLLQLPAKPR